MQREDQTKLERTLQYQCHKHTEAEEREKSYENEEMKKEKKREREIFKKKKKRTIRWEKKYYNFKVRKQNVWETFVNVIPQMMENEVLFGVTLKRGIVFLANTESVKDIEYERQRKERKRKEKTS